MRSGILLVILSWSGSVALAEPAFPEAVRETITRVCGFCHYPDFFDDATGELIEQRFLDKKALIQDRLQRPFGAVGRMPPKRSPVSLTEEERQLLLNFLATF